jgi:ATP-binding cassette subfamily B protein
MRVSLRQYWNLLVEYLRPLWRSMLLLAALVFASIGLQLANPQVLRHFIDSAQAGAAVQALAAAAVLFMTVAVVNQAVSVAATYVSENVGWTATNELRARLSTHCLQLDMPFHKSHTPGEMIERIDGDVTALATFFSQFVLRVLANMVLLVGVLVLLWREDWRVGLTMVIFTGVALAVLVRVRSIAVPHWAAARQARADVAGFLEERLAGTEDIRSSGGVPYVLRRFYEYLRACLHTERRAGLMAGLIGLSFIAFSTLGTGAALGLGAFLYRAEAITIGTVYLVFHYVQMLFRPLNQISNQMQELQKASAGIERIAGLFALGPDIPDDGATQLPQEALSVEFRRVTFGYDQEMVLHDVSFFLPPGQVLGILGRTGSGKTTVTRLLSRLYDPGQGAILLGGVDIRQVALADLRRRVGVVTQDVQLFRATVRDNLTFFDRSISDERILQVLEELGLGRWYRSLPMGLDTELESGGSGLSAGEGQLLAFSRVFLRDPGLVILDEASSRLDSATEQLIERAVDRLLAGRTAVIVAHRLATVHRADEIMIIEDGAICEHGPRERLAADPRSRFAGLLQTGLEEALA